MGCFLGSNYFNWIQERSRYEKSMDIFSEIKSFVWSIFPPESNGEIFIRTIYHRITSTKPYVSWKIFQSENSYKKWYKAQQNGLPKQERFFEQTPKVSFFLCVEQSDLVIVQKTISSIKKLINKNWELLILGSPELIKNPRFQQIIDQDNRIIFYSLCENPLTFLLTKSSGEFFLCCQSGDTFESHLLDSFYTSLNSSPESDIYYCDCDEKFIKTSKIIPFFKPDIYSPELHLSINYQSRSFVKKSSAVIMCDSVDPNLNLLNQEWELTFLLKERNAIDKHIPQVLIHQVQAEQINIEQECSVIKRHFLRTGITSDIIVERCPETRISWNFGDPTVSIIILSKNHASVLKKLINSLFSITIYPNFEVIIVDNNSDEKDLITYYTRIVKEYPIRVVNYNEPFNYSRANNIGASFSQSDLLLFMNNDMEITDPYWLRELCQWATLPEIGIVGAKLIHMNNTIQHVGVILGLQGFIGHLYLNAPEHFRGLAGSVDWYRNYYALTGACQMMRRSTYLELGGYDEDFQLVFSDIELCLRSVKNGYRNLYTPNAVIKHLEGRTRGYQSPNKDIIRGFDLFSEWIEVQDPNYSAHLTYTTIPMCHSEQDVIYRRSKQISEKRKFIQKGI